MRIAITTWFGGPNAGTYFQLMGLYKYLESRGHHVEVVNYKPKKQDFLSKGFFYYFSQFPTLIAKKLRGKKKAREIKAEEAKYSNHINARAQKFQEFYSFLNFTDVVSTDNDFYKLNDSFDVFVVGSDQVWNSTMLNRRYLLDYVKPEKIKASYAPSVGTAHILSHQRKVYAKYLSDFSYVSTREGLLAQKLNEIMGEDKVKHVLDPSMLFPKEEYEKMAVLPTEYRADSYVLCYFIDEYPLFFEEAKKYAEINGKRVVVMAMAPGDYRFEDASIYAAAGPAEFLGLIKNAFAVFSGSFHCTIFSILFNKNLFVLHKKAFGKASDTSLRYVELINTFEIAHRLIEYGKNLTDDNLRPIDYNCVNDIFERRLTESKNFLNQFC